MSGDSPGPSSTISWRNRHAGEAKLKLQEMGSRYLFNCLYVWLEKYFSRGDYRKSAGNIRAGKETNNLRIPNE